MQNWLRALRAVPLVVILASSGAFAQGISPRIDQLFAGSATLPTGATPAIDQHTNWTTANTGTTTITNITGGFSGQTIHIFCGSGDTFTSIAADANFSLLSTWSCPGSPSITLTLLGSVWTETGRQGPGLGAWTVGVVGGPGGSDIECQNASCLFILAGGSFLSNPRVIIQPGIVIASAVTTNSAAEISADTLGGALTLGGATSGSVKIGVPAVAGSPNPLMLPSATGGGDTFLMTDGGNPQQLSWNPRITDIGGLFTYTGTAIVTPLYATAQNCTSSASPAVCGSASAGAVVIAAGTTTVTIDTTEVDANSDFSLVPSDALGTRLGVTCNNTLATLFGGLAVTAINTGVSFQVTSGATPAVNPLCFTYVITN
ncbi:MAG TPA: hypothetical protein VND65_18275 [Candidatus Binatia bacterium]|nr:hypothetical protein [Candidatus Binatia bacterium]